MTRNLSLIHLVVTAAMTGLIWTIQLVVYPLLAEIDAVSFPAYHFDYCRRITWVVGPLMVAELVSAAALVALSWRTRFRLLSLLGLSLVGALWLITGLVQLPQHELLSSGKEENTIAALVAGNWVRTALWTIRIPIACVLLRSAQPGS